MTVTAPARTARSIRETVGNELQLLAGDGDRAIIIMIMIRRAVVTERRQQMRTHRAAARR